MKIVDCPAGTTRCKTTENRRKFWEMWLVKSSEVILSDLNYFESIRVHLTTLEFMWVSLSQFISVCVNLSHFEPFLSHLDLFWVFMRQSEWILVNLGHFEPFLSHLDLFWVFMRQFNWFLVISSPFFSNLKWFWVIFF